MAIVGFEQDPHPDAPMGAGLFTADSGEQMYAHDPELASSLVGQDDRLAFNTAPAGQDFNSQNLAADAGGQQPPTPPPSVADVGPQMSMAPPPGPAASMAPPQSPQGPAPAPRPQAQPPAEVDPDEQARAQQQAAVNRPVRDAASPGGYRPRTSEESFTDAGLPLDPEQAQELQRLNENVKVAKQAETGLLVARAQEQTQAAQAALPDLILKQKEAEERLQRAQDGARHDLQQAKDLIQATNEKKIDPGRMFQGGKGAIAGIFAVIAQSLGAYAAIKSKTGRNFGAEIVQQAIDRDIAAQKEEIDQGRAGANNMLAVLQRKYDYEMPQAEAALRMAQNSVVQKQLAAFEGMKLSQDAMANLGSWQADLEKQQFLESRKLYEAGIGKHSRRISSQFQAPTSGGLREPTHAEKMGRYAEIEAAQKTGTIAKPGDGKEQIDPKLIVYDTSGSAVAARTEKEATDIRKQYAIYKKTMPSVDELEKAAGFWDQMSPDQRASWALNFESAASTFNTGLGQNSMKDDDFRRWHDYLQQGGLGAKKALAEMRKIATNSYQAEVDSQTGPQVKEDFSKGKPKAGYTKKRATTPTVGRSQAGSDVSSEELKKALEGYGNAP
jgi:hypothetical protein